MRKYLVTAAIAAVAAVLLAAPAFAGKGGNHGGTTASTAWVSASPNPGTVGQRVYVTGCGYAFAPVILSIVHPTGYVEKYNVGMWSTGCMDGAAFVPSEAGTYTINILQTSGNTTSTVASTSLNVG